MKKKAVGYVSVLKKDARSKEHKKVLEGFQLVCNRNDWELVKIYEDKKDKPNDPTPEMIKMFKELSMNKNSEVEISISYAFGQYIVNAKNKVLKLK
ncbi:hypothetical protein [Paucisalibacillus globulus]|uniref:hypothetical protein n=1 Tax=Paucisalibacillus globulus TaxID=351095 RepID=UPI0004178858|nr:hypothetical protein [Paucisalibacillus globulus]